MKIAISIRSIKDLNKLKHRLFLYRSILCLFVKFYDNNSLIPVDNIIDCLNIKNRKKRITYIYDNLCKQIDTYYQDKNICKFEHGKCFIQKKKKKYTNGCCRRCKYVGPTGCTSSNFACKMFYCSSAAKGYTLLTEKDLPLLKCLSIRQRFILRHDFFSSREEVIKDLCWESVFINLFRIYPRFISNIILKKR